MRNLFKLFKKEKLWDFQGGIHPPEMKTQSSRTPLRQLPLPSHFIIPLKQHIGHEGEMLVKPGDKVLRGQPLTFGRGRMLPVHAPTSGTVDDIAPHMTAHPSALAEMCIFITPDGEDRWIEKNPLADYRQHERAAIVERIHQAGVAGLGGAGFPTATKLRGGLRGVKTLIINAAECEPYITADDRLMQDCADEVIEGSRILGWVLQAERVLIGIEDNKPEAIAALKKALGGATDMQIRVIPTKYPSGGAKQLTKILTGLEVPHGGRSTDISVLMQNVGTAWAVKRAIIDGEPLTERVVTLTGEAVKRPGNVWGRIGTPISHLLQQADFTPGPGQMVVMGGPLMGFTLPTLDVPVVKITNCILAPSASEMGDSEEEKSCIRCSACADACPAALLPQQLYWYSRGGDHDKAREHNIDDCIECGACAYVCPSNIPLVQYYRQEKAEIRAIDLEAERTAQAKARFEARQARLEREKLARENRHQQAKRTVSQRDRGEVEAALERVKAKQTTTSEDALAAETAAAVAQREARKAQARAQQAEKQSETEPATRQAGDPRKAAVEAAIARAKAKKATTEGEAAAQAQPVQAAAAPVDPRKAAVEAAVARAKAKKAAAAKASADDAVQTTERQPVQAAEQQSVQVNEQPEAASVDPRKAAVEAAIARAKAKKAAAAKASADDAVQTTESQPVQAAEQQSVQVSEQPEAAQGDPRKAAVEAAIARAKAKKAAAAKASADDAVQITESQPVQAAEQQSVQVSEQPEAAQGDPRKAAVEAAIARAKAKKAAAAKAAAADDIEQRVEEHQAATTAEQVAQATTIPSSEHDDPRKAAVAAAIARVKARKAQHSTQED